MFSSSTKVVEVGVAPKDKICDGVPVEAKICNVETGDLEKIKNQEAANLQNEENGKLFLTAEEHEALSRHIPKEIREGFATKVWALLSLQMACTFLIAVVCEAAIDKPAKMLHRILYWCGSSFVCFIFMSLLRNYQAKYPLNYLFLVLGIIATGIFWGMTKFIVQNFFNHNVCGIIMGSLILSAICFFCGITGKLAVKLEPKVSRQKAKEMRQVNAMMSVLPAPQESDVNPDTATSEKTEGVLDKLDSVVDREVEELRKANDGILRAGMLIGIFTWFVASAGCYLCTFVMIKLAEDEDFIWRKHYRENAKYSSALLGAACAFPLLLFFHADVDRQMRKCRQDQHMKAIVNINSDIALAFIIMYALCAILACNQSSVDMRADDMGGGGGMDVGGGGGMDGAAGGDAAGADAAGADAAGEVDADAGGV